MIQVLVISPWFPTDENPNYGIFVKEQTKALVNGGVIPSVLYYNDNLGYNPINLLVKGRIKDFEIQTNEFPVFYKNGLHLPLKLSLTRKLWIYQYLKLFKKYVSQFGLPDIIHAHTYWGGLIALEVKNIYNIPYLITEHSSAFLSDINKKNKKNISKAYNGSSLLIAVGKSLQIEMENYTRKKIEIIPNSINTSFFKSEKNKKPNKHFNISTVGGLIPRKQIHLAISATNLLYKKGYNIKLNIVGSGELYENLDNYIKNLNAENYIKLLGKMDRYEVKKVLNESDLYLHTSKIETFGIVLIEAMSMGLPIITVKSGGPESYVTDDIGIIIDNDSPEHIANAITLIIANKNKYNSNKIRKYVVDNFSDEIISKKIITFYNLILRK